MLTVAPELNQNSFNFHISDLSWNRLWAIPKYMVGFKSLGLTLSSRGGGGGGGEAYRTG